jgi:hypothetical protein
LPFATSSYSHRDGWSPRTLFTKISLIYNTEEVEKIEEEIEEHVAEIQKLLLKNKLNHEDPEVLELWEKVEELESKKDLQVFEILNHAENFVGIALVSFQSEVRPILII